MFREPLVSGDLVRFGMAGAVWRVELVIQVPARGVRRVALAAAACPHEADPWRRLPELPVLRSPEPA